VNRSNQQMKSIQKSRQVKKGCYKWFSIVIYSGVF